MAEVLSQAEIDQLLTAISAEIEPPVIVPGANLTAKLDWLRTNAQSNGDYIVEVSADESIGNGYGRFSYSGKSKIAITLKGTDSTRIISLSKEGDLFIVDSGVTLVLDNNITLRGRNNNAFPLVAVSGHLIMNPGSAVTGNTNTAGDTGLPCGGVLVLSTGRFTMNGGTVSGNTAEGNGGGVFVYGTFIMRGGTVCNNTSEKNGGGVMVAEGGTFDMIGGTVSRNTAKQYGCGMYLYKGTFTMSGGTVCDNAFSYSGSTEILTEAEVNLLLSSLGCEPNVERTHTKAEIDALLTAIHAEEQGVNDHEATRK